MTKQKCRLGFWFVLVGFLFYCNPYFGAVDIFPDFIGSFIIFLGLVPLARVNMQMRDARRAFLYVMLVDLVKQFFLITIFGMGNPAEQPTMLLICSFLSATVGVLFAISAVRSFFEGLEAMGSALDAPMFYASYRKNRSRSECITRFTVLFFLVREIVCLLPEFASLMNSSYTDSEFIHIYDHIGFMRAMAFSVVLVFSVIWVVKLVLYFVKAGKETAFWEGVSAVYGDYMECHPGIRVRARHAVAFGLLSVGMFFTADFYLDFHNVIPDYIAAILLIAGILLLDLSKRTRWLTVSLSALYGVVATVSSRIAYRFSVDFSVGEISKSEEAAKAYTTLWCSSLAELLIFMALLVFVLLSLRETLKKWGGYLPQQESDFDRRSKKRISEEFDGLFIKCFLLGFLSALLSFLFDYIKEWPNKKAFHLLEFLWMPDFVGALLFAFYFLHVLNAVMSEIKARFQFE